MIRLIKKLERTSREELEHLQTQRKKANKQRKPAWQKKINKHFGV